MVQEKKQAFYGKWCLPTGHLELHESIIDGAIREIKEETGCDVKVTGVATIENSIIDNEIVIIIIFVTELINETIKIKPNEILDIKWWNIEEVLKNMDDVLRPAPGHSSLDYIKKPIQNMLENKIAPVNIFDTF